MTGNMTRELGYNNVEAGMENSSLGIIRTVAVSFLQVLMIWDSNVEMLMPP